MRNLPPKLHLSDHGWVRLHGRGVSRASVEAALRWGQRSWSRGALRYFLGRRAVQDARRRGVRVDAHEGTVVVLSADARIITVYRNHQPKRPRR